MAAAPFFPTAAVTAGRMASKKASTAAPTGSSHTTMNFAACTVSALRGPMSTRYCPGLSISSSDPVVPCLISRRPRRPPP